MIPYPASLKAVGGARTGIDPVNLLDVQDVNGNLYYWSDRPSNAPVVITGELPTFVYAPYPAVKNQKVAWAYPRGLNKTGYGSGGLTAQTPFNGTVNWNAKFSNVHPPGDEEAAATFSDFALSSKLPADAVIEAIYPVTYVYKNTPMANHQIALGSFSNVPGDMKFEGEYWGQTLGTSLDILSTAKIYFLLAAGIWADGFDGEIKVSFVGLAIYYTSQTGIVPGWGFAGEAASGAGPYIPWLVEVPSFTFHRSLITDVGSFVIQNLSGDSLSRSFEKIARRSALEGAFFVYRCWQADAEAAWLEVHGTLSCDGTGVDIGRLKGTQLLNPSQDDTPLEIYCETCQLQWGGPRCGATGSTECSYSYQTCQSPNRIMIEANHYEKNYGETVAYTAQNVINRRRTI